MTVIDARGRRCPLPILDVARVINDIAVGDTLVLAADDPAAAADVAAWCRMRGHELVGVDEAADGCPEFTVRRLH